MDKCQIDNCKLKIGEMNWASQWTDSLGFENWWQLADNVLSSFFFFGKLCLCLSGSRYSERKRDTNIKSNKLNKTI